MLQSLEQLYEKALNDIRGEKGVITINIGGIPKTSRSNDIIGNCVQEWIPQWLEDNGLKLETNPSSQTFPDFTANINGKKYDMEIKCWNYNNKPAFDVSNFDGFYREIYNSPAKLYAKYLIFGYNPTTHGFKVENIYLKNLWEITGKSTKYPIGLQVKQGRPFAIRPISFHKPNHKAFADVGEFVKAIYEARKMFELSNMIEPDEWLEYVTSRINNKWGYAYAQSLIVFSLPKSDPFDKIDNRYYVDPQIQKQIKYANVVVCSNRPANSNGMAVDEIKFAISIGKPVVAVQVTASTSSET